MTANVVQQWIDRLITRERAVIGPSIALPRDPGWQPGTAVLDTRQPTRDELRIRSQIPRAIPSGDGRLATYRSTPDPVTSLTIIAPPQNTIWDLLSLSFSFVAGAVGGDRRVQLLLVPSNTLIASFLRPPFETTGPAITANTSAIVTCVAGGTPQNFPDALGIQFVTIPLEKPCYLFTDDQLQLSIFRFVGGTDRMDPCTYQVREWQVP